MSPLCLQPLSPSRDLGVESGHTLIELLVTLALVAVCTVLPIAGFTAALDQQSNRNNALICQAAAVAAQVGALGSASGCAMTWNGESLTLVPDRGEGAPPITIDARGAVGANVARWRRASGLSVLFLPATASPDSAGSIYFGGLGNGQRVVVRLESGLTRRESR